MQPLRLGALVVDPPVVLAPMAGVTNPPFRTICRSYGAGLYVSEMVVARAVVERHRRTAERIEFWPDENPRSLQLYGTDPRSVAEAIRILRDRDGVDHVDLNLGCPARKVMRNGGGAALPVKRRLVRSLLRQAVAAAGPVPVTAKFRIGVDDVHVTYLELGRIAEEEGVAAVALHARTAAQLYSGEADWSAIARLKEHVAAIPVLGNGDIWEAHDALAMVARTGCDGVVVGRGCLGRPWLFGQLTDALAGRPVRALPALGEVTVAMRRHAELLVRYERDEAHGLRQFRKHAGWYLTGYPVGSEVRRRAAMVGSLAELDGLLGELDPTLTVVPEGVRAKRGHTNGPQQVSLPHGWLDDPDEEFAEGLPADADALVSGG